MILEQESLLVDVWAFFEPVFLKVEIRFSIWQRWERKNFLSVSTFFSKKSWNENSFKTLQFEEQVSTSSFNIRRVSFIRFLLWVKKPSMREFFEFEFVKMFAFWWKKEQVRENQKRGSFSVFSAPILKFGFRTLQIL